MLVNNKIEITADTISISSIENNFDVNSIVTIKAPEVYSFEIKCLISELENVGLYKKGKYELTFVDRVGNSYQLIVNITGKSRYSDVVTMSTRSYTSFYNAVYMNDRTESEEIIYDVIALKIVICSCNVMSATKITPFQTTKISAKILFYMGQRALERIRILLAMCMKIKMLLRNKSIRLH